MIYEFEIKVEDKENKEKSYKFQLTDDPLYESIEQILDIDNKIKASLIGRNKKITKEESEMETQDYVMKVIFEDPEKMAKFLTYNDTSAGYKTIILCTGMTLDQIKKLPYKTVYKPLLDKCKELLGGTADDFLKN